MESSLGSSSQSDTNATINTYYGKCKCCLESGYMKTMWSEYHWEGIREIYGEMLMETFSLSWDSDEDDEFICESCVLRLRDAYNFKKEVLASELLMCDDLDEENSFQVKVEDADDNIDYDNIKYDIKVENLDDGDGVSDTVYYEVEYLEEDVEAVPKTETVSSTVVVQTDDTTKRKKITKWPRKKKKEEVQRPYKNYSDEDMRNCLQAIQQKEMSISEATRFFGLPRKTVTAKLRLLKTEVPETPEELERYFSQEKHFNFVQELKQVFTYTNVVPFKIKRCRYHCAYCYITKDTFEDPDDLRLHTESHGVEWMNCIERMLRPSFSNEALRVDIRNLQCTACNVSIKEWEDMFQHLEDKHQIVLDQCRKKLIPFRLKVKGEFLGCAMCDVKLVNFTLMDSHMNSHFCNYMCADCGDTFLAQSRLKYHTQTHSSGRYPCKECGKIFSLDKYMQKHLDTVHKKLASFKCIYCSESCISERKRHAHVLEKHKDKVRLSTCELCGKTFTWRAYYLAHLRKVHSKEKKNKCSYCYKAFVTRHELKLHEQRHTGTGQHYCDFCEKNFVTMMELKSHLRVHAKCILGTI